MNPGTVRLHPVLHDDRTLRNVGLSWLKQHNFVIFRDNQIKLGGKVYILQFNNFIKYHAKIWMACSTKVIFVHAVKR